MNQKSNKLEVTYEVERLKKIELDEYCKELGIETKKRNQSDLVEAMYNYQRAEIDEAIKSGNCLDLLKLKVNNLADEYANKLKEKIIVRRKKETNEAEDH